MFGRTRLASGLRAENERAWHAAVDCHGPNGRSWQDKAVGGKARLLLEVAKDVYPPVCSIAQAVRENASARGRLRQRLQYEGCEFAHALSALILS